MDLCAGSEDNGADVTEVLASKSDGCSGSPPVTAQGTSPAHALAEISDRHGTAPLASADPEQVATMFAGCDPEPVVESDDIKRSRVPGDLVANVNNEMANKDADTQFEGAGHNLVLDTPELGQVLGNTSTASPNFCELPRHMLRALSKKKKMASVQTFQM